jgi:Ca2+-binding EF-hand superfamily protein
MSRSIYQHMIHERSRAWVTACLLSLLILTAIWQTAGQPATAGQPKHSAELPEPKYLEVDQFFSVPAPYTLLSLAWKDDCLWAGLRNETLSETTSRSILTVDLDNLSKTGKQWIFPGPGPHATGPWGEGGFFAHADNSLFVLMASGKIQRLGLPAGAVREFDAGLPPEADPTLVACGKNLFLLTVDRILELDPRTEQIQIIASKRRYPAASDLDSIDWQGNPQIVAADNGGKSLLLPTITGYEIYQPGSTAGSWTNIAKKGWSARMSCRTPDGNFILQGGSFGSMDIQLQTATNIQTLFSSIRPATGRWGGSGLTVDIFGTAGRLMGSPPGASYSAWDGTNLWALAPRNSLVMSPFTNPAFKVPSRATNAQAVLWFFDPRLQHPLEIPLKFTQGEKFKAFHNQLERSIAPQILATPKGLLLLMTPLEGFWFIPRARLDQWIVQAQKDTLLQPNMFASRLTEFDLNRNGVLDYEEAKAFNQSAAYQVEASTQTAREMIAKFDIDMDGTLDEDEVWRGFKQELALEILIHYMVPNVPREDHHLFMTIVDENKDGRLDANEMAKLLRTGRRPGFPKPTLPGPVFPAKTPPTGDGK